MKEIKKVNLIIAVVFATLVGISAFSLGETDVRSLFLSHKETVTVNTQKLKIDIPKLKKAKYILQLKYKTKHMQTEIIKFNETPLELRVGNISNDGIASRYYYVPAECIGEGGNLVEVNFFPDSPQFLDLRIKNYLASVAKEHMFLTLKNNSLTTARLLNKLLAAVTLFVAALFLWQIFIGFSTMLLRFSFRKALQCNMYSFTPCTFLFIVFSIISHKGPYSLVIYSLHLCVLFYISTIFSYVIFCLLYEWIITQALIITPKIVFLDNLSIISRLLFSPRIFHKFTSWLKKSTIADKIILFFIVLFTLAAFLLALDFESLAERIAGLAFWLLLTGAVLKVREWWFYDKTGNK